MSHTAKFLLPATFTLTILFIISMPAGVMVRPVEAEAQVKDVIIVNNLSITQDTRFRPGVYRIKDTDENGIIQINADNITVDGSGTTIDGNDAGGGKSPGYAIRMNGHTGVKLRNFKISGYKYGISIENASNVLIENSNVSGNYKDTTTCFFNPLAAASGVYGGGILFRNVSNSIVQGNTLVNQSTGLEMIGGSYNKVLNNLTSYGPEGNESTQNSCWGIRLQGSTNNLLRGNIADYVDRKRYPCNQQCRATDNCEGDHLQSGDSAGILLIAGSHNNSIISNSFTHGGDGFFIGNSCLLASNHNYVYGNDGSYSPGNAFECTFSDGNIFENNLASHSQYGFWLGYSYNTRVTGNEMDDMLDSGIAIDSGHNNEFDHNVILHAKYGIRIWSGPGNCPDPPAPAPAVCDQICPFTPSVDCPTNCPPGGVTCQSSDYRVHHNSILLNMYGLTIENTSRALVARNLIKDNTEQNVWLTAEASAVRLLHNDLTCQTDKCKYSVFNCILARNPAVSAQNNWWGTDDAQVISGRLIHDKVEDSSRSSVAYQPYALEPITITSIGSGPKIEQWAATSPLPQASAAPFASRGQPLVFYNNHVYIFGGKTAADPRPRDVYYNTIRPDGTLGNWIPTTQLPGAFDDQTVVRVGNYFYLLTGASGSTAVYYAPVNADGSIGNWSPTSPLNPSRQSFAAASYGKYIYVSGGNALGTKAFVQYTSVGANGALNPWANTVSLPEAMQDHTMTVYDGLLYVFAPNRNIYIAQINTDGKLGAWQKATGLSPQALNGYATFERDGYFYLLGGSSPPPTVYYLPVLDDLLLGRLWQTTSSLPVQLMASRVGPYKEYRGVNYVGNDYVYVAGGYDGANYRNTVYYAPLMLPGGCQSPDGELLTALFTGGLNAVSSRLSYTGLSTITVTGIGQASAGNYSDAFYVFADKNGNPVTPTHSSENYNWVLSINGQRAENFILGGKVPGYRHDHHYNFRIKAPAGPLSFGVGDAGASDNTGSYHIGLCGGT